MLDTLKVQVKVRFCQRILIVSHSPAQPCAIFQGRSFYFPYQKASILQMGLERCERTGVVGAWAYASLSPGSLEALDAWDVFAHDDSDLQLRFLPGHSNV